MALDETFIDIDEMIALEESDPKKARLLKSARKRLGKYLEESKPWTLASLRLKNGYSRKQLAEKLGISEDEYGFIEQSPKLPEPAILKRLSIHLKMAENNLKYVILNKKV